jgi:hypothetical protein
MEELRFGIGWVMQRLRRADLLDEASTTAVPTDWAWSQAHVDIWRHLVVERGWGPSEGADHRHPAHRAPERAGRCRHSGPGQFVKPGRAGPYCAAARRAWRSSFSASAIRKASSSACEALRRGSQWVW